MKCLTFLTLFMLLAAEAKSEEKIPHEGFLFDLITHVKEKNIDPSQMYLTTIPRIATLSGATYHKHAALEHKIGLSQAKTIVFKGTESILDLGCCDGAITAYLAQQVPAGKILGIDNASSMIDFAQTTFNQKNLSFAVQNSEKLSYKNEFDVVTSFFALQKTSNLEKTLEGIYNALKPQGKIFLFFPMFDDSPFHNHLIKTISHPKWKTFFKHQSSNSEYKSSHQELSITSLEELCAHGPFAHWQLEASFIPYTFTSKTTFKSWHKALDEVFNFVPWKMIPSEKLEDEFINDLMLNILIDNPDKGEFCTIRIGYALITATK